jgi:hypothetical protein
VADLRWAAGKPDVGLGLERFPEPWRDRYRRLLDAEIGELPVGARLATAADAQRAGCARESRR